MMNTNANFKVYQASAGSGKTFTLIKEYLKLCLKDKASVGNYQNILAITFTNATANEMKEKIVNNLCEITGLKPAKQEDMKLTLMKELNITEEELKSNAQALLTCIMHDYSNFCVSTIDAFVQKLSRSFAHDLGLPNQYTVSIDDDEMAEAIIENIGLRINENDKYLIELLEEFSEDKYNKEQKTSIENELSVFAKKLLEEKTYKTEDNNQITDSEKYKETRDYLKDKVNRFEQEIKLFTQKFRDVEHRFGLKTEDYWKKSAGVVGFIGKLENKTFDLFPKNFLKALETRKCLSDEALTDANDALLAVLDPLKAFYEKEYGKYLFYNAQLDLLYLYALRVLIREEFAHLAEEKEVVHISEFNKLLNTVMGDFSVPFIYERLGERFKHVFIDEFQDTSVLQWQNMLPLVHNGLSENQMSMVVGDGKQSIYRFRSGEVKQLANLPNIYPMPHDQRETAFQEYQEMLGKSFEFERLDTNYRSFWNVVEFNNTFFDYAYKQLSDESQQVYVSEKPGSNDGVKIEQKKSIEEKGLVQVELYDPEAQKDYCFERVATLIHELTANCGYHFADITLLVRRTEYGSLMANYLNAKGVPVVSKVSILLKSSEKVQLLVYTLRYLLHDDNKINLANLLYFWNRCQHPEFKGDINGYFDEVDAVMNGEVALEKVMGIGEEGRLRGALLKATCLYDFCASLLRIYNMDTMDDAFLNYFMEEVYQWQSGVMEGIESFLDYWDKKKNSLSVKSTKGDAVQIMTIHKSKGLEFPVVIYPEAIVDLDERLKKNDIPEDWVQVDDLDVEPIEGLKQVLFKLNDKGMLLGEKAKAIIEKEKESNRLDNLNLLYVAFTRAGQRLYIIARQGAEDTANLMRDFMNCKKAKDLFEEEKGDVATTYRFGAPDFRNPKEKKAEGTQQSMMMDSRSAEWFDRVDVEPDPMKLWKAETGLMQPREWGELVHGILAKIKNVEETDTVLIPYIHEGIITTETAGAIKDKLLQMSQDPQIAAAFDTTATVKTECEIYYPKIGKVIRLDRYAELPDVIYLIDYKTGKREEAHQKQIRTYSDALREMTDKEIRAYLVYLAEDTIEVEKV